MVGTTAPDHVLARKMWRTLEPYHGMIYFSPKAADAYEALGIRGRGGYFASRSAAMGAVPAEVVIATFYNFHPGLVRHVIPEAWTHASPAQVLDARLGAVDAELRELLGDDEVGSPEMVEAAELARRAADACRPEGRPLYVGHASLPWPDEPHLALWHAITLLREYRGDGHIAALVIEGFDGCEALVTHGAAKDSGVPSAVLQASRAWPQDEWDQACERLRDRGLLEGDALSPAGEEIRQRLEDVTDERAMAPWNTIGSDAADRLRTLVRPFSKAISQSELFLAVLRGGLTS